jgi:hypothetical protein
MRLACSLAFVLAACHHAAPVDAPQAPPSFTGHGDVTPDEILAHWRDGSWTVAELVDPQRGLVHFWTETGDVEPVPPDIQTHLCGAALSRLPDLEEPLRRADVDEGDVITCDERECTIGIAGEYEPGRVLWFAGSPTALVAYLELDSFTPDAEEDAARVRAWATAEVERGCPP